MQKQKAVKVSEREDSVLQDIQRRGMKPLKSLERRPGDYLKLLDRYTTMPNAKANRRVVKLCNASYEIMFHQGVYYGKVQP